MNTTSSVTSLETEGLLKRVEELSVRERAVIEREAAISLSEVDGQALLHEKEAKFKFAFSELTKGIEDISAKVEELEAKQL